MSWHLTPACALVLLGVAACGSPGRDVVVDVAPAPKVPPRLEVAQEVGRLLSSDPATSKAAERRLLALTDEDRDRFLAYAATLHGEHDMRLLNVLDEQQALPDLPPDVHLDFLLWKAARPERFYVVKAQSRLMGMARKDPAPLIARMQRGGPGTDVLEIALALSGRPEAFDALLARYRGASGTRDRAAAAEALGLLAGAEHRPRASGSPAEIEHDAAALEAWHKEKLELEADVREHGGEAR